MFVYANCMLVQKILLEFPVETSLKSFSFIIYWFLFICEFTSLFYPYFNFSFLFFFWLIFSVIDTRLSNSAFPLLWLVFILPLVPSVILLISSRLSPLCSFVTLSLYKYLPVYSSWWQAIIFSSSKHILSIALVIWLFAGYFSKFLCKVEFDSLM